MFPTIVDYGFLALGALLLLALGALLLGSIPIIILVRTVRGKWRMRRDIALMERFGTTGDNWRNQIVTAEMSSRAKVAFEAKIARDKRDLRRRLLKELDKEHKARRRGNEE